MNNPISFPLRKESHKVKFIESNSKVKLMAKKPNKIEVIARFIDNYLSKFEKNPDPKRLLMNLIADGITDPERIRNFMIVDDYYRKLEKNNGHSSNTVIEVAETYHISERQIQNILYKWSAKYKEAKNVVK